MPAESPLQRFRSYDFRLNPETRELAFDLLPLLRADPNVQRLQVTDFLIAYRDEEATSTYIGVQFRPGLSQPADPYLHEQLQILEDNTLLDSDADLVQTINPITLIQRALYTSLGRRRLARTWAGPAQQRLDYRSAGRLMFPVEPLPDGAAPAYAPNANGDAFPIWQEAVQSFVLPPQHDVEVVGADDVEPDQPLGWAIREELGVGVINSGMLRNLGLRSDTPIVGRPMVLPWPSWVVPGIWLLNLQDAYVGRIVEVSPGYLVLFGPKGHRRFERSNDFEQVWEPTVDPLVTLTLWDRLG